MKTGTISQTIVDAVSTWEGVTIAPHRFGGIEFRVDNREIGHLHGDYQADIPSLFISVTQRVSGGWKRLLSIISIPIAVGLVSTLGVRMVFLP